MIDRIATQLLWRHVSDRAEHHARRSDEDVGLRLQRRLHRRGDLHLRQTEVEDLHEPATCLNQVGALDVAMSHATAVRFVESVGNLGGNVERFRDRQGTTRNALRDQLPLDILHRDEHRIVVFDEVVGDGDVR